MLGELAPPVHAVIGIGESAAEVVDAFGSMPHRTAATMDDAVEAARALAVPGDAVVLSPGCASFDWYDGYAARGDDFARSVRARVLGGEGTPP